MKLSILVFLQRNQGTVVAPAKAGVQVLNLFLKKGLNAGSRLSPE